MVTAAFKTSYSHLLNLQGTSVFGFFLVAPLQAQWPITKQLLIEKNI